MENWEDKVDALARATLREDVRILAGVPSWMLVVAKRVLELSQADTLGDVWPNLQLYMHGGVSFEPYRAEFDALIGGTRLPFDCLETYNASEGFFGLQDRLDGDDYMMLDYGIAEFGRFPVGFGVATRIGITRIGGRRGICMDPVSAGLWRYALGMWYASRGQPFRMRWSGAPRRI